MKITPIHHHLLITMIQYLIHDMESEVRLDKGLDLEVTDI